MRLHNVVAHVAVNGLALWSVADVETFENPTNRNSASFLPTSRFRFRALLSGPWPRDLLYLDIATFVSAARHAPTGTRVPLMCITVRIFYIPLTMSLIFLS